MSTEHRGAAPHAGQIARQDREAADLTRAQLAAMTGLSHSHIKNVENGHRPITQAAAEVLARALGHSAARYAPRHPKEVTNP